MTFPIGSKVKIRDDSLFFWQGKDSLGEKMIGEVQAPENEEVMYNMGYHYDVIWPDGSTYYYNAHDLEPASRPSKTFEDLL